MAMRVGVGWAWWGIERERSWCAKCPKAWITHQILDGDP
jgi:hypothetical protein